jgi:hypothetical protein
LHVKYVIAQRPTRTRRQVDDYATKVWALQVKHSEDTFTLLPALPPKLGVMGVNVACIVEWLCTFAVSRG